MIGIKYIKYPFRESFNQKEYKEKIKLLPKKEKRNYYISRFLMVLCFISVVLSFVGLIMLAKVVGDINNVFGIILEVIIGVSYLILPIFVIVLYVNVIEKFPYKLPLLRKDYLAKINKPFFKYYNIGSDYIITKCYICSDDRFINKDVIIFIYNGKIRICNNFYYNKYDLGCYELDDYELYYDKLNNLLTTNILCDDFNIVLGRRALAFIKKSIKCL